MSRVRISHAPDGWRDDGPSVCVTFRGRYDSRPAVTIPDMQPVLVGTVLSMTRERREQVDAAHARYRARHSIVPENRYPDDAA